MKLTDENGGEWEAIHDFVFVNNRQDLDSRIIRKVRKPNPMPELRPGMIVRIDDRSLNRKDLIIIQDIDRDENLWGINIERGWQRMKFYDREIIEVCYPRTIDVIWSREP